MSEDPSTTTTTQSPAKAKTSPLKTRFDSLGYFFGQPLQTFENLLTVQPSTSSSSTPYENISKPTDRDIIRHWIYQEDQNRTSKSHSDSVVGIVTDNLIAFYEKYHTSVVLR